jgi:putative ABC transport system permease protein
MTFTMDYTVFGYITGVCVMTSVLFGLAPAVYASRVDLAQTLKESLRTSTGAAGQLVLRALVVAEVSLALVLLVAAGLMVRSFQTLAGMSADLEHGNVLTMQIGFGGSKYIESAPRVAVLEQLEPALVGTSGVEAVALASTLPLWFAPQWRFELDGQAASIDPNDRPAVAGVEVSSQYFDVLGVPLLRGRTFTASDGRQGEKVAIVNRRFVDRYWPGQDPIGKQIRLVRESAWEDTRQTPVRVIGEVADVKQNSGPNSNPGELEAVLYVPLLQDQQARQTLILARTRGDAHALANPLRASIQKVIDVSVNRVLTLPEHFAEVRWFNRVFGLLFVIFAVIGSVLAAIGIYGVISYAARQRTHEIGIRGALGAERQTIVALIVREGVKLSLAGLVIGLLAVLAITRVMRSFLIGVTPTDPLTITIVFVVLVVIAALASYVPARRAASVDPVRAFRTE